MTMTKSTKTTDVTVTAAAARVRKPLAQTATDTEHNIARRAYELYLARACKDGHDADDWAQAERELQSDRTIDDGLQAARDRHA